MIWLTWRQFRASGLSVLGALAAAAVVLAVTGPRLTDLLATSGDDFFARFTADGLNRWTFYAAIALAYAVPGVIGAFWGAPMIARELETGTHRLAWSQSVGRGRWLATKLAVAGSVAVVGTGLLALAVTWWCAPLDDAVARGYSSGGPEGVPRISPDIFGSRGIVVIGMAVLALAVGVTAGLVIRRTVAAMAATLVVVVAVQILMPLVVQRHLMTPDSVTTEITSDNLKGLHLLGEEGEADPEVGNLDVAIDQPGAWIIENRTLDPEGNVAETLPPWVRDCGAPPGPIPASVEACFTRLAETGYRQKIEYQPASRFWPLQWRETGILFGAAFVLAGFCFWRIRRDLA